MNNRLAMIFKYIVVTLVLIVVLFPFLFVIITSFKPSLEILAEPENLFPSVWSWDNYIKAWNSDVFDMKTMLFNSVYYTLFATIIIIITSSLCGYVFARGHFPGKRAIFAIFASTMFINMGSITVYALFKVLRIIHLNKSLAGLLVLKVMGLPMVNIYLVRSYINTLPKALDEAAIIDGCSFTGVFFRIIMPLLKPILATIGLLALQASWNEYLMPTMFTLSNPEQQTLMVGLYALKNSGESAMDVGMMLAASTMAMLPVLIAYAFGNKFFINGIVEGAVKG